MPAAAQTFYEILGIGEDATPEEVSAVRRSMIKAVHPDLALDEADRQQREHMARTVNDMCDTLLDPIRRYDYDAHLARARRWPDGDPDSDRAHEQHNVAEHQRWEPAADDADTGPDLAHALIERLPGLARLEQWLTWPVAGLVVVMFGVSVYLYNTVGGQLLDHVGLHFGRFGSLGVVIILTALLVAACLGLLHVAQAMRGRSGRDGV